MGTRYWGGFFGLAGVAVLLVNLGFGPGHWLMLAPLMVAGWGGWLLTRRWGWKGVRHDDQ